MEVRACPSVTVVDGLFPTDTLTRLLEARDLPGTSAREYGLAEIESVQDAITRSWSRLTAIWTSYRAVVARVPADSRATSVTRDRWLRFLFDELGYGPLRAARAGIKVGADVYPVSHEWESVPVHLLGWHVPLDSRTAGVAGAATRSPQNLVQDLLNRSDRHLWGIVSNGRELRLLRASSSIVQSPHIEFDLEEMFERRHFSDYMVLYLLCHHTRVELQVGAAGPADCWLERWYRQEGERAVRALHRLQTGVIGALQALGEGFVAHKDNSKLREDLDSGGLKPEEYLRVLMRLVFRLLFCLVAEERGLLPAPDADPQAKERYERYFSLRHLRVLARRRPGTSHGDLWDALGRIVFGAFADDAGCSSLGLPTLDTELFDSGTLGILEKSKLSNRSLLATIRSLDQFTDQSGVVRTVDFRGLGGEELGSIYESLLRLEACYERSERQFSLANRGNAQRKATGTYYTPMSLIDGVLDAALDPLLDEAERTPDPRAALLALTVCDPACGSGQFLVAAARRIAQRLVTLRDQPSEPSDETLRIAMRDVIARCIYGVDVNELALEVAKLSLWLEAFDGRRPLPFLGAHLRHGNALVGVTPSLLRVGIPDQAFACLPGDDRAVARQLALANRQQRSRSRKGAQGRFFTQGAAEPILVGNRELATRAAAADAEREDLIERLRVKIAAWRALRSSSQIEHAKLAADAWCAAFLWPRSSNDPSAPTYDVLVQLAGDGSDLVAEKTVALIRKLAATRENRFFHWHLEFPQIFQVPDEPQEADNPTIGWTGGFSCIVGNPPWDRLAFQDKEFLRAVGRHDIANAPNANVRKRKLKELRLAGDAVIAKYDAAKRASDSLAHMLRRSGRYPLSARRQLNTYALFVELGRALLNPSGQLGMIVPTGIATDETTSRLFETLVQERTLVSLFDFDNESAAMSRDIDNKLRFCLLTITGEERRIAAVNLAFALRHAKDLATRRFAMTPDEIALLNPNTGTCPAFPSRRDAEIALDVYRHLPILQRDQDPSGNPWDVTMTTMFHMAGDSGVFRSEDWLRRRGWRLDGNVFVQGTDRYLPLYEAKMLHLFDHRFGTYEGQTESQRRKGTLPRPSQAKKSDATFLPMARWWVPERAVRNWAGRHEAKPYLLGWRDVSHTTNERMVIPSILPHCAAGHTIALLFCDLPDRPDCHGDTLLLANFSALVFDYLARAKQTGYHVPLYLMRQLPVVAPETYESPPPWGAGITLGRWVADRVLELVFTAEDLSPYAAELGYDGPPFLPWNEERRAWLRAELDAAYFHLYRLDRAEVIHVLEMFPVLRRRETAELGEYRTGARVVEMYDRMAEALWRQEPFQSLLDPPPGAWRYDRNIRRLAGQRWGTRAVTSEGG
jgi:hypothetical protein